MSFKTLFVIIVKQDLNCEQVNIVIVFLNSTLQESIYVKSSKSYRENEYV